MSKKEAFEENKKELFDIGTEVKKIRIRLEVLKKIIEIKIIENNDYTEK